MFLLAHDCCHVIADTLWKRILRKHMMEMERQKDGMVRHSVAASASEVVDSSVARSKSSVDVGRVGNAEKEVEVGGSCMSSSKGDDGTCSQKRGRAGQGGSVDGCGDGKVWNGRNEAEESDGELGTGSYDVSVKKRKKIVVKKTSRVTRMQAKMRLEATASGGGCETQCRAMAAVNEVRNDV